MSDTKLLYYTLICDKKKKVKFLELMASYGAVGIETVYGRGSAKASAFAQALGFETEEHKVVISALMLTAKAEELTRILQTQHDFQHSNTGIAFGIPVEGMML